jgi:hypothetical protein
LSQKAFGITDSSKRFLLQALQARKNPNLYRFAVRSKMGPNQGEFVNRCDRFLKLKRIRVPAIQRKTIYQVSTTRGKNSEADDFCGLKPTSPVGGRYATKSGVRLKA